MEFIIEEQTLMDDSKVYNLRIVRKPCDDLIFFCTSYRDAMRLQACIQEFAVDCGTI